jgi:hypothetical protein
VVYHAVPAALATSRKRVEAFGNAWNRHVSPGHPIACQSSAGQAIVETYRGENPLDTTTQLRRLWR